jgi:apolipoprotein N-acyltransferase
MFGVSVVLPPISAALHWNPASPWPRRALAVLAGVCLALSFPGANIAGLAWIAPGLMLLAARGGAAFRLGYLAAFTHYLISLSWLLNIPVRFFPILGWIALAAYLALYPALWTWFCERLRPADDSTWTARTGHALACAAAWVAMEMLVSRVLTGFPWNLLGVSQHRQGPLIQIAAVTGVHGVSFVVAWFSAALFHAGQTALRHPGSRQLWVREIFLSTLAAALAFAVGWHWMSRDRNPERNLRVALVQPSIPQTMIWSTNEADARFTELLKLTAAALTNKPDLVIWPEAAVPNMLRADEPTYRAINDLSARARVPLLIGSDDFGFHGTNVVYFNSAFLIDARGQITSTYRKRRLVIFGEYVPLAETLPFIKYLTPISGGFTPGKGPVSFDLGPDGPRTSVLICFEDTFPHYAREHAAPGLDFLVNITNDGWFGESAAQWQHAANAAFRAVENGLPLVRCANNGITCWIDARGRLRDVGFDHPRDVYRAGFKVVEVPLGGNAAGTFYNRHGDWFGWTCVALTGAVAAGLWFKLRRR